MKVIANGAGLGLLTVIGFASVLTSHLCHPRFVLAWSESGQCSASDQPSEVFAAMALLGLVPGVLVSLIFFYVLGD